MTLHARVLAPFICVVLLAACNPGASVSSDRGSVRSSGERITLKADGHPRATIDADGSLSIDGEPVEVTDGQRALLRTYHAELNGMTQDGIAIGKQGAALAGKAASTAIRNALRGGNEDVGKAIEADARRIEQDARRICQRLVLVQEAQDQLAAELPAFGPYATILASDVDDCMSDGREAVEPSPDASDEAAAAQSESVGA